MTVFGVIKITLFVLVIISIIITRKDKKMKKETAYCDNVEEFREECEKVNIMFELQDSNVDLFSHK